LPQLRHEDGRGGAPVKPYEFPEQLGLDGKKQTEIEVTEQE